MVETFEQKYEGNYKSLIYCSSMKKRIQYKISKFDCSKNNLNKNVNIVIKLGDVLNIEKVNKITII